MVTENHTNHAWRKYFYLGVGFAAHSRDILQKSVDEVVKHGKVNEAEGKKIVDSALQKLESGYNETVHKLGALSTGEISKLKTRIDKLEKQLSISKNRRKPSVPTAVKKATVVSRKRKSTLKKVEH